MKKLLLSLFIIAMPSVCQCQDVSHRQLLQAETKIYTADQIIKAVHHQYMATKNYDDAINYAIENLHEAIIILEECIDE